MQLRKRSLGLAVGLVWGFSILLVTWWLLIRGNPGEIITKLSAVYPGYSYSWGGSFLGLLWGFVDGFIGGFFIALIYNWSDKFFTKPKTE